MKPKTIAIVGGGTVVALYLLGSTTVKVVQDASGIPKPTPGFFVNVQLGWQVLRQKLRGKPSSQGLVTDHELV